MDCNARISTATYLYKLQVRFWYLRRAVALALHGERQRACFVLRHTGQLRNIATIPQFRNGSWTPRWTLAVVPFSVEHWIHLYRRVQPFRNLCLYGRNELALISRAAQYRIQRRNVQSTEVVEGCAAMSRNLCLVGEGVGVGFYQQPHLPTTPSAVEEL